ncbi:hypothetical protein EW146_g4160 [Bondarzewia mesenterica]|uniref:DUF3835 domain-containing protein n=1 Tax=Bondarzewia mesenterica TaxID=1095465 RepID=A0A4V3XF85_9AGAM|nr:hypothetical protein EW146_g4160 [Bondarzewia mesenterica]
MTSQHTGATQNLGDGRAQALQALLNSVSPNTAGEANNDRKISREQAEKLSEKLSELLDDAESSSGPTEHRNERGELLNEEGLPIIDIAEPVPESEAAISHRLSASPEAQDIALSSNFSGDERAQSRAEMNRMLDLLEDEENREEEENERLEEQRRKEELENRKANARKELERNVFDARDREEKAKEEQLTLDMEQEAERKRLKPKKSVSFADLPSEEDKESSDTGFSSVKASTMWGDVVPGRLQATEQKQPMKFQVVERFPGPSKPQPLTSPPPPDRDSDDESDPGSSVPSDSDDGQIVHSDHDSTHDWKPTESDDDDDDDEDLPEDPVLEDEFDFDTASHHREVALQYYEKRSTIGADAVRAMSAHSHAPAEDKWDQPEVPLEATLSKPPPKPAGSRFKSSHVAQVYNTSVPSITPSKSLGASVLPASSSSLKHVIRNGKLENNQLVGGGESESASDDDDENIKAFLDAFRRGDVTNAGAQENSDALIAALTQAYAPTPDSSDSTTKVSTPVEIDSVRESGQAPVSTLVPIAQKTSKFKLNRPALRSSPLASDSDSVSTPVTTVERSSPKLPTSDTVIERKPGQSSTLPRPIHPLATTTSRMRAPAPSHSASTSSIFVDSPSFQPPRISNPPTVITSPSNSNPQANIASSLSFQPSSMIVESPSFQRPQGGVAEEKQMPPMIVDSPSFQPQSSSRPSRPPLVMASTVKESLGPRQPQVPVVSGTGSGKRLSKFKAER